MPTGIERAYLLWTQGLSKMVDIFFRNGSLDIYYVTKPERNTISSQRAQRKKVGRHGLLRSQLTSRTTKAVYRSIIEGRAQARTTTFHQCAWMRLCLPLRNTCPDGVGRLARKFRVFYRPVLRAGSMVCSPRISGTPRGHEMDYRLPLWGPRL